MDRIQTIFNEKFDSFAQTYKDLANLLDNKNITEEKLSIHLRITQCLEQLKLHEASLATVASIHTEPLSSDLNNRINTLNTQHAHTVSEANARLLDLETKIAGGCDIPDSEDETEFQLTAPRSTTYTPLRSHKTLASASSLLKPPQLSIPIFQGDSKTFSTFWRQFTALIHNDPNLNNRQKSIYLAEALQGPARVHLENKSLDGTDYERITKTLKSTYSPKLNVAYRIYDELSKLPIARNDPTAIRCRVNEIRALLDQLDNSDLYNSEDPAWVKLITMKFPSETINMLCWRTTRATSIKQLLENIESTADSMENFSIYSNRNPSAPSLQLHTNPSIVRHHGHTPPVVAPRNERPCVFCDQLGHRSAKCLTITTPQQRRDIIKQKNRCWICFSPTHTSTKCTFDKCKICKKDHHPSLCIPPLTGSRPIQKPSRTPSGIHCTLTKPIPSPAYLMTSKVSILNPITGQYSTKIIFLDPGASESFIYEPTAKECQLHAYNPHSISTTGFTGKQEIFTANTVEAVLRTQYGKNITVSLLTSPKPLTGKLKSCRLSLKDKEFLEKSNITITNQLVDGEIFFPDILLGIDWFDTFIQDGKPTVLPSGLKIRNTQIGPCIYGRSLPNETPIAVNTLIVNPTIPEDVMIKQLFEIDNLGIAPHEGALNKSELFYNEYSTLIKFDNGFITAPLPLKTNAAQISSNRSMALATLNRLQKSLKNDSQQQDHYNTLINKYLEDGVVEPVPPSENTALIYYMPHRGVWKPNKAKPLRIVFNASAKQKGQLSLNDVTATGESFNNKIIDILLGIRAKKFFLMCDIEGAFTQIRITNDHKDLCRFLWLQDPNKGTTPDNVLELRFNRLAFGITASPSILNMSLYAFLKNQESDIVQDTLRYLYIDNIFYTTDNAADLPNIYHESKAIFSKISMNVREYFSNSPELSARIPNKDQHPDENPKILGVQYNASTDSFTMTCQLRSQHSFTKRDLLSSLHSIYDPLGLAAPLLLNFKLLLRQVMNGAIDWKDQVPIDVVNKWNDTSKQIGAAKIQISRKLPESRELWIFVDASILAIAACAYFMSPQQRSPLVMGKLKLAPKNRTLTIPRLEMTAILLGMKIADTVYNNMADKQVSINIASDSQIALSWVFTRKSVPVFISNLRQNIEQIIRKLEHQGANITFHYVDTSNNPADIGTRGTTDITQLQESWLLSPRWLSAQNDKPAKEFKVPLETEEPAMIILPVTTQPDSKELLLAPERFSSYFKLRRTTTLILTAALKFLQKVNRNPTSRLLQTAQSELRRSNSAYQTAEILLIKEAQHLLTRQYKQQFRLQKDAYGLLTITTRLKHSSLPQKAKNPYLLPKKSALGKLILTFLHRTNAHAGVNQLLYLFMSRFYMAATRQVCKTIIKRCVACQKTLSHPFSTEFYAPLPEDRVTRAMPFRHTGLDCIGPIKFKKNDQIYIVIFTCLTIRAVHLEPINDMTSNSFINAFIRFVARRGLPHILRSDNGSNFTHAAKILKTLEQYSTEHQTNFMQYVHDHNITWIFNTPSAPWTGGVWERLVAVTKRALYKSLSLKIIDKEQLVTAIIKIEGIINSRPITYTDSDNFHKNPLTPADFFTHGSPILIPGDNVDSLGDKLDTPNTITSNKQAFENLQKIEIIAESFWSAWEKEYLLTLRHAHASRKNARHNQRHPYVNEVVLVEEDNINRNNWSMARITELIPSSDKITRTAKIQYGNRKLITKPVEKLYPLELFDELAAARKSAVTVQHVDVQHGDSNRGALMRHIFRILLLLQIILVSSAEPLFTCLTSHVRFHAIPFHSTVCIDEECHQLPADQGKDIPLSVSVKLREATVLRFTQDLKQSQSCELPHPCDFPPPMILHIFGNPHCDPALVILLVLAPIFILILMGITIGRTYQKCKKQRRTRTEPRIPYIPSALFALVTVISLANACNDLHIRNNIEIICDDIHNCTTFKSEDISFNPLEQSFCSAIKFQNATIGKLEINVLSSTFTCRKLTQGFTRITNMHIYSLARCLGTPDCPWGTGCDHITPEWDIRDLHHTYNNPGHTYCTRAGGGLLNGCGLPIEGCLLFRPVYIPETESVYEEIRCTAWEQEVNVEMTIEYVNNTNKYNLTLQPYRKYKQHGITLQVSSTSLRILPELLNKIFLVSSNETFMIPENKKPAVICNSRQAASLNFKNCRIRKPCSCLAAAAQLSCSCESAGRRELEQYKLPLKNPKYKIDYQGRKLQIISFAEETTMSLENPDFNLENLYTNRYPCYSNHQKIAGCYNCKEGVELIMDCDTKDELFAILNCRSFSVPIRCSSKNPVTTISLFHDKPNFKENCTLICGKAEGQLIRLSAKLYYIADFDDIFRERADQRKGRPRNFIGTTTPRTDLGSLRSTLAMDTARRRYYRRFNL